VSFTCKCCLLKLLNSSYSFSKFLDAFMLGDFAHRLSRSQMPTTAETSTDAASVQDGSKLRAKNGVTQLDLPTRVAPKSHKSDASVDSSAATQPSHHKTALSSPTSRPDPTSSTTQLPRSLGPLATAAAMLSGAERTVSWHYFRRAMHLCGGSNCLSLSFVNSHTVFPLSQL